MSDRQTTSSGRDRPFALAQKIIIAAFKIVLPDVATRIEGVVTIAELIVPGHRNSTLSQLLERNMRHLAKRLKQFEAVEFAGLTNSDKDIAIGAVFEAIDKAGITRTELITADITGKDIFRQIEEASDRVWRSYRLSEVAASYARMYLREATTFLAALVRQLPDFSDELLIAEYDLTFKIYELLSDGINEVVLPQYRQGKPYELSAFESEYRSAIIGNNNTTEVFGLNVPEELRKQPIDIAYITLKAAPLGDPAAQADQLQQGHACSTHAPAYAVLRVDDALGEVVKTIRGEARAIQTAAPAPRGARVLLTGPAGSGKTTIAQWIAIRAAQRNFPEALEAWNACTPFVVPLRDVFPGESRKHPTSEDLVHPATLRSTLPGGWLESKLHETPLIILDGLDELSRSQKTLLGKWIQQLDRKFPNAHIVAMSRPEGLDSEWLSEMGFVQLALQQMSLVDIRRCVGAWFKALITISIRNRNEHQETLARLVADIERQDTLRELASTPLLCAMLCAFYAYRHTAAPETRADLYREVVKTLVYEREHDRNADRDDLQALPEKQRLMLLQALARHMTDNSVNTIHCTRPLPDSGEPKWPSAGPETAEEIIQYRVRRMALMVTGSDNALDILLRRSIVFRRITYNEAHFAHRSIQEYLAACDYVNDSDIAGLAHYLDHPQSWSIIVFAAGQLSTKDASDLVSRLLKYAKRNSGAMRRSAVMLAAECYVAAGGLREHVAAEVEQTIKEILPPVNADEAEMVARCGSQILPLLKRHRNYPEEISAACVRAAAMIGGADALKVIANYVDVSTRGGLLIEEIINAWQRFDADKYVQQIIGRVPLRDSWVGLRTPQVVRAAGALGSMRKARLETYESEYDFQYWQTLPHLEELDFAGNWRLGSFRNLRELKGLRKVDLSGAKEIRSIDELGDISSLREICLSGCRSLTDISALANLEELTVLVLDGCSSILDFSPLASLSQLLSLSVNGCLLSDLSFCTGLSHLQRLRAMTRDGISDASYLGACPDLHGLEIRMSSAVKGVLPLPGVGLRSLTVEGRGAAADFLSLNRHTALTELRLSEVSGFQELTILNALCCLKSVSITDCPKLRDASGLVGSSDLMEVDLSGSKITDTRFIRDMPQLRRVILNRCRELRDISSLLDVSTLEYVSCLGVPGDVYPALQRLGEASTGTKQVAVVYEPLVEYEQPVSQRKDEYSPDWESWGEFYGDQG